MTNKNLKKRITGIEIDIDNMIEGLREERKNWPDRFDETDNFRLNELQIISAKIHRVTNQLSKYKGENNSLI